MSKFLIAFMLLLALSQTSAGVLAAPAAQFTIKA